MEFSPEYCLVTTGFFASFGIVAFLACKPSSRLRVASFFIAIGMMIVGIGPALGALHTLAEYLALGIGIGTGAAFHRNRAQGVVLFVLGAMLVEAILPVIGQTADRTMQTNQMLFVAYSAGWVAAAAGWDLTMVGWRLAGAIKQKALRQR